jgi:hypothetical protein
MALINIVTDTKYNTILYLFSLIIVFFSLITTFNSPNFKNLTTINFPNIVSISIGLFICLATVVLGFIKIVVYQKYFINVLNAKTKNYVMILNVKSIIIITFLEIFVYSFCTGLVASPLIFGDSLTSDNKYIILYLLNIFINILIALINIIGQFYIVKEVNNKNYDEIYTPILLINKQASIDNHYKLSVNTFPNNYYNV